MSEEVKVTIEWNGNTAGLHSDPMTVHFAGKADPKKVIGAVVEAMGMAKEPEKPKCKDGEAICVLPVSKDNVRVILPDGTKGTFASYREALQYIETMRA